MGARYFEHKARRAWWTTHLEAWRRSGVTRTEYCRLHRLTKSTFDRWLSALNSLEFAREEARKRRKRTREPVSGDKRNKAVQAFWAMHVEALSWSGVSAKDYAAAHHISVYSLRTWRARLDADPVQIDWRAHLHPSIRAQISTGASSAAKEQSVENSLTDAAMLLRPATDARTGAASRMKRSSPIVLESEQPGMSVAAVCRRHASSRAWCSAGASSSAFGRRQRSLATVTLADEAASRQDRSAEAVLHDLLPSSRRDERLNLPDGRRVFAPEGSDPEAVRQHVLDREAAR